jgi:hypothetical protein
MCKRRNIKIIPEEPKTPVIEIDKLKIQRINSHGSIVTGSSEYYKIIEFRKIVNSDDSIVSK